LNLTPEQLAEGRRNFLKVLAGTPALAALGAAAVLKGPVRGGPVRLGFIGVGGEGRVLLEQTDPAFGEVRALCDVNPTQLAKADAVLAKTHRPPARHYAEWKEMLEKEDLEAVVIAVPLWKHADITAGCLEAGKHALCEKMMAWDVAGCESMIAAARKSGRILEIGYQRMYNPIYHAAYDGIVRSGALGDIYHARLAWHRNASWRRHGEPPSPGYDPSAWGYPSFEHLLNWRLYWKYSKGLLAELASHQVEVANWFLGGAPVAVQGTGGVYRFKDREVYDHVYVTFEYPQGRTAVFSSIESNAFDNYYEMFFGTKGTLLLRGETEAYLFEEGGGEKRGTGLEVSPKNAGPVLEASESRAADAAGKERSSGAQNTVERVDSYRREIAGFCSAIRVGTPLACGTERALQSAKACIRANEAIEKKERLEV
jgi:predicted dehydrogenase